MLSTGHFRKGVLVSADAVIRGHCSTMAECLGKNLLPCSTVSGLHSENRSGPQGEGEFSARCKFQAHRGHICLEFSPHHSNI